MGRALIVGAGGHGRSVAEALLLAGDHELAGFLDDIAQERVWEWGILGPTTVPLERYRGRADAAIVAIGNNRIREDLHGRLRAAGFPLLSVIHPRASVSPTAMVASGCAIMAGAIIGTEAKLGEGAIVNSGAVVDHHCILEPFAHVGANAAMAGGSILGRAAWMQAGSSLGYSVRVAPGEVMKPGESKHNYP